MPNYEDLEKLTYGEIARLAPHQLTLEQRVKRLEVAVSQIYPHAHCHPEDCPSPAHDKDRQQ